MAMIVCKECKKEISNNAEACPHCGYKPYMPKFGFFDFLIFVVVILMVKSCVFDSKSTSKTEILYDESNKTEAINSELPVNSTQELPASNIHEKTIELPNWKYSASEDEMTSKQIYFASLISTNTVNFGFPYDGEQRGHLLIRDSGKKEVMFFIEKGQILCRSYDDCTVEIRFDENKPETFSASETTDNSSEHIFISNGSRFFNKMKKAKIVKIKATIYKEGLQIFEFKTDGFKEDLFKGNGNAN